MDPQSRRRSRNFAAIAAALTVSASLLSLVPPAAFSRVRQSPAPQPAPQATSLQKFTPITVEGDHFVRDGKPYQIISGEMHYARIPHEYWRDRMRKARAMGLNTIQTYAFWNAHEPKPDVFDFSGDLNMAEFIRTAQEENLNVLVRLGPYACAEWDAGGFPAWLFADPSIQVRTTDPKFLEAAGKYLDRIGQEVGPLVASKGGPVIGFQIENEYGSYGSLSVPGETREENERRAHQYMAAIKKLFVHAGLGDSLFYTADGTDPEQLADGTLPGVLAVANFGPGEARDSLAKLQKFRPGQPVMNGEYWDGWFDSYGQKHATTDLAVQVKDITWMLEQGYSFNLYMAHGGTTFGFMNGANFDSGADGHYAPETTSYDYDAPLDEAGRPTKKFFAFRDAIAAHTGVTPEPVPTPLPVVAVPEFQLPESAPLWKNLPNAISVREPRSMETFGQSYGYIIYRAQLQGAAIQSATQPLDDPMNGRGGGQRYPNGGAGRSGGTQAPNVGTSDTSSGGGGGRNGGQTSGGSGGQSGGGDLPSSASGDGIHIGQNSTAGADASGQSTLVINGLRDFAAVYIDRKLAGTLDRRLKQTSLTFRLPPGKSTLDIVVENTGRVNFGAHLADGRAGIVESVTLNGREVYDWKVFPMPMAASSEISGWNKHAIEEPAFHRGTFNMDSPADTFLDVGTYGKGFVWVNGHNAGRIWYVGPQQTLYVPAPWLKRGANEVIVFDFAPQRHPSMKGVADPIYETPSSRAIEWRCEKGCTPEK